MVRLGRDAGGLEQVLSEADSSQTGLPLPEADLGDWDHERDSLWGTRYFVLAVTQEYLPPSVWKLIGEKLKVDAIARQALAEANTARKVAQMALDKIDGMRSLIRSLEDRLDRLTPGIGE